MQQRDLLWVRAVEMRQALNDSELVRRRGDEREPAEGFCKLRVLQSEDGFQNIDKKKPERVDIDRWHHGLNPGIGRITGLESTLTEDVFADDLRVAQEIVDHEHGRRIVADAYDLVAEIRVQLQLTVQVQHETTVAGRMGSV